MQTLAEIEIRYHTLRKRYLRIPGNFLCDRGLFLSAYRSRGVCLPQTTFCVGCWKWRADDDRMRGGGGCEEGVCSVRTTFVQEQ